MQLGDGIELVDLPCAATCGCGAQMSTGQQAAFDGNRREVFCLKCLAEREAEGPLPPTPVTPMPLTPQPLTPPPPPPGLAPVYSTLPNAPLSRRDGRRSTSSLAPILVAAILLVSAVLLHAYLSNDAAGIPALGSGTAAADSSGAGSSGGAGPMGDVRVGRAAAAGKDRADWPPIPSDAQSTPLALPPAQPYGSMNFEFISTLNGTTSQPVRWDPCRPIHLVVNSADAPAGADRLLREAVAEVSAATGLTFSIEGPTTEQPSFSREAVDKARYGNRWSPVLVVWTDPSEVPDLKGNIVGLAGPSEAPAGVAGDRHYVSGMVYLDGPDITRILKDPQGGRDEARSMVMHELGHLVGLAHVNARSELMYPVNWGQRTFGEGDLEGLRRLGDGPCFSK
jgi:hypothetical protein